MIPKGATHIVNDVDYYMKLPSFKWQKYDQSAKLWKFVNSVFLGEADYIEEIKWQWIDVNKALPLESNGYYLVYTNSGLVDKTFYLANRDDAKSFFGSMKNLSYSRKHNGKNSIHFELGWMGHKVTHWSSLPKPPINNKGNQVR